MASEISPCSSCGSNPAVVQAATQGASVALDAIEQQGEAIQELLQTAVNLPEGSKGGNINLFA